jgi:Fe-S oxidoreductase
VTPCPACIIQLRYGARRFGVPVRVLHLTEILRRTLASKERVTSAPRE